MPKKQRRTFTAEFKKQMVQLLRMENPDQRLSKNTTLQLLLWTAGSTKLRQLVPLRKRIIVRQKKLN